jgi:hypothetical protein
MVHLTLRRTSHWSGRLPARLLSKLRGGFEVACNGRAAAQLKRSASPFGYKVVVLTLSSKT